MQSLKFLTSPTATAGLICFALAGPAWGQQGCIDPELVFPDPVDPTDSSKYIIPECPEPPVPGSECADYDSTEYSIPAPSVSEFGSNLTCADIDGQFGGVIPGGMGTVTFYNDEDNTQFTVFSTVDSGVAEWKVRPDLAAMVKTDPDTGEPYTQLPAIDTSITDAAQGGNGCLATHIADAVEGQLAYRKSNGSTTLRNLYVCANSNFNTLGIDPEPAPAPVKSCDLLQDQTVDIFGVAITCPTLAAGEQRTIIVSKDSDSDGNPVPGYGFLGPDGQIDFNNVCICKGPSDAEFEEPQCDPNPDAEPGEECTVEADTPVGVNIEILNPRCVTVGGRRRCY